MTVLLPELPSEMAAADYGHPDADGKALPGHATVAIQAGQPGT